jgi:hypothetical protein
MKVLVVFEFVDVELNSPEAEIVVQNITEETERMCVAFDAQGCWVKEVFDEKED